MAQKYYNSADAAKALGITVDDVKSMIERRELYGYRDGADWKFKVEDIDRMAAERQAEQTPLEDEGGDVLLSEVALGQSDMGTSGTVIAMEAIGEGVPESDIQLAGSDIKIAESAVAASPKKSEGSDPNIANFETLNLSLDDDVALGDSAPTLRSMPIPSGMSGSAIDLSGRELEDDDLVLGGSSAGSDVAIGADSGISLIDPADSGLSLDQPVDLGGSEASLAPAEEVAAATGSQPKSDSDFMLTPLEDVVEDGSESGSQVIALDTEADDSSMAAAGANTSMASMLDEDFSAQPSLDLGMAASAGGSPLLGAQHTGLAEGTAPIQTGATSFEAPYTSWQIAGLATCVVLLMICGMMMYDLLRNMWSWGSPYTVNSWLMDLFVGK